MKLSVIFRVITVSIFWVAIGLFVYWFFELEGKIPAVALMSLGTALVTYFARLPKNKGFSFLFHLMVLAIPGICAATELVGIPVMIYGMGIGVISYITKLADSTSMDKGNWFGAIVLVILYLLGAIMDYSMMGIHLAILIAYTFLVFVEANLYQSEEYIEKVGYHAVFDAKKVKNASYMIILTIAGGILIICIIATLMGKTPPLAALSAFLCAKWKVLFKFLKRVKYQEMDNSHNIDSGEVINPVEDELQNGEEEIQEIIASNSDIFVMSLLLSAFIVCCLYIIYAVIKKLYKKFLQFENSGVQEEHINLKKEKKVKENPAAEDKYYNNRTAIRKIYKKRIKGKRFGRRDDLKNCTPMEQLDKSLQDGNEVSLEMVELYEKARYSKEEITKTDVKNMNKI